MISAAISKNGTHKKHIVMKNGSSIKSRFIAFQNSAMLFSEFVSRRHIGKFWDEPFPLCVMLFHSCCSFLTVFARGLSWQTQIHTLFSVVGDCSKFLSQSYMNKFLHFTSSKWHKAFRRSSGKHTWKNHNQTVTKRREPTSQAPLDRKLSEKSRDSIRK